MNSTSNSFNSATSTTFDSVSDLISYAFKLEQTSMLSLERICEIVQSSDLYIKKGNSNLINCSTISRRRISSALSSSELFVRAGANRACLWAIRPNNPLLISDGQISASIEQMLTTNGPMTLEQMVQTTDLNGCDEKLFERFLNDNHNEFSIDENINDGKYWFTGKKRPTVNFFDNICQALIYAFSHAFPRGACVEELHWFLCLSTVGGHKTITRRNVSRELSRRTDLFMHISRARYTLLPYQSTSRRTHSLPRGIKVPTNFHDQSLFENNANCNQANLSNSNIVISSGFNNVIINDYDNNNINNNCGVNNNYYNNGAINYNNNGNGCCCSYSFNSINSIGNTAGNANCCPLFQASSVDPKFGRNLFTMPQINQSSSNSSSNNSINVSSPTIINNNGNTISQNLQDIQMEMVDKNVDNNGGINAINIPSEEDDFDPFKFFDDHFEFSF